MAFGRSRNESLSSVDVAWYQMEDPTNLMMITGLIVFDELVDYDRLQSILETRLVGQFRRFRQRVVTKTTRFGRPYWEEDPNFDIASHLHRIGLPAPGDHDALQALVSDLMSQPLDFSKPLWQFHLVDGYDGRSALLLRLHHCIADGIALIQVMLSLTDRERDAPPVSPQAPPRRRKGWNPLAPVTRPAVAAVNLSTKAVGATVNTSIKVARKPEHLVELARSGSDVALTTARLLLMGPDPKTAYKGKLGVSKRAAWSKPIPLEDVKLIGRAVGGTVNDVLMSAAAGAMGRYLVSRGKPVDELNVRALIPVNLRPPGARLTMGNKFGLVFLSLPLGIEDPVERLRELKRRMDGLKNTSEPVVAFGILGLIGMMPDRLEDVVVDIFGTKGTVVMTNVPGPREQLYFAGASIDNMMFWVPQSGRLGIGISILSYNGKVMIGVATDSGLIPDPDMVVASFHAELAALRDETRARLIATAAQFDIPVVGGEPAEPSAAEEVDLDTELARIVSASQQAAGTAQDAADWTAPEGGDDLTRVRGIGPAFASRLAEAGIVSYADLATSTPEALQAIIAAPDWRHPDYQDWIAQAGTLAG
ncbi:MAG: wax ester/triacylglycerol synthase family O-acyltransferase [Caldilineales bacterium]